MRLVCYYKRRRFYYKIALFSLGRFFRVRRLNRLNNLVDSTNIQTLFQMSKLRSNFVVLLNTGTNRRINLIIKFRRLNQCEIPIHCYEFVFISVVPRELPAENSPSSNSPAENSPEENSPVENSPISFSQIIFVEKMFLFLKIEFSVGEFSSGEYSAEEFDEGEFFMREFYQGEFSTGEFSWYQILISLN